MAKGVRAEPFQSPRSAPVPPTPGPRPARRLRLLLLAAISAGSTVGCYTYDAPPFDPRVAQQQELSHRLELNRPPLTPLPTTLEATPRVERGVTTLPSALPTTGRSVSEPETVRMPLREVLQRSVMHSGEVRVAGYDPAINQARVIEAQARYDPSFFSNFRFDRTDTQTAGQSISNPSNPFRSISLDNDRSDIITAEAGLHQLLPGGGEARLSYQIQESYYDPARFRRNPFWDNQLKLEITQPLLKNFGADVNNARINIARNDQRISVLEFRRVLEENLSQIEQDYWQLYQSQREVEIQEELLLGTIQTYTTLLERNLRGLLDEAPVRQAQAFVYSRQGVLIQLKQQIRDLSADMKRRMNDPDFPVSEGILILPADAALAEPVNFETREQFNTAVEHRLELGQQLLRIDSAVVAQLVAKNNQLPKLDLVVQGLFNGVGDTRSEALQEQTQFNHFGGSVGLQFEYPIGNREARSIYVRAQLQVLQAQEQYRNQTGIVMLEVVQALNQIDAAWQQVLTFQQGRLAGKAYLDQLQRQEDEGAAKLDTNFVNVKLQAQETLADAKRQEATAIATYNIALQRLERAKGTLLRYNNIILEEDPTGNPDLRPRPKR